MIKLLCRQLRYIDIITLRNHIGQNLKNILYSQLGYFDKVTYRVKEGRMIMSSITLYGNMYSTLSNRVE